MLGLKLNHISTIGHWGEQLQTPDLLYKTLNCTCVYIESFVSVSTEQYPQHVWNHFSVNK